LEAGERDIEKRTFVIETSFKDNRMEVWIPPEHIPKGLMSDNNPSEKGSAGGLVIELTEKTVD
jgi:hypothetical protein